MSKQEGLQKIDIFTLASDYFGILHRMWKRISLLVLVGAVVGYSKGDSQYYPQYTASATFTINIRQEQLDGSTVNAGFFDNAAAEQMAKTFPYILTSGVLQNKVAKDMGVSYISGRITASVKENTNLLTIMVSDADAERAYRILHSVIENYPQVSEAVIGKVNMEMLDETGIPPFPDNPKNLKRSVVKGAVYGGILGFLWAGIVMLSRKTIRHEEDCPKLINHKCLGSVPQVRFKERSRKIEHHLNILEETVDPGFAESFRVIRNKVQQSARANHLRSILITSALAGEGKSTTAVNLAVSLAQEGKKVALVDCDLRHPSDHEILGVEEQEGLAEYLQGKIPLKKCLISGDGLGMEEDAEFIFVPAGYAVEDGSDLLESPDMQKLLKTLDERTDYVILDSAPCGLLTDAGVLAQFADGVIFVVKEDYARADHILESMEHLADGNVYMIGCVLNGD